MPTLDQISADIQFARTKKQYLQQAFEQLQSHSSSVACFTLRWEDLETHFGSIQSAIDGRFELLQSKEIQLRSLQIALDRRAEELEFKEWQLSGPVVPSVVKSEPLEDGPVGIDRSSLNANLRFCVTMDGRSLQLFLNERVDDHERMGDEVLAALRMSADPAKLVLDAMEGFYPPHLKKGVVEVEAGVARRTCVLLLKQLTRVRPKIRPKVREEAVILAGEWKLQMRGDMEDSLEVLGFLWLLVAYGLVSEFDKNEILKRFENVAQHTQANELCRLLGLTDTNTASCSLQSQVKTKQSPSEHEVNNAVASSSLRPWPELKSLCINMDVKGLGLFLNEHVKEHDSICCAVHEALQLAPDPAKLVVDVLQFFFPPKSEPTKCFKMGVIRKSCILLLEQLFRILPPIEPHVKEAAVKLAVDWKEKLVQKYEGPQRVLSFFLLLVVYGLSSSFEPDEILGLLVKMDYGKKLKVTPDLCLALGLADKIPNFIQDLIERNHLIDAIRYIYAFDLVDKFQPVAFLKSYVKDSKWRVFQKAKNRRLKVNNVMNKELAALRDVMACIAEHHLESEYPPEELKKRIEQLEKKKADKKADKKHRKAAGPKPQPLQQGTPGPQLLQQGTPGPQLLQQNAPDPQPQLQSVHEPPPQESVPKLQPPQENVPKLKLLKKSVPKLQLPKESVPKLRPPKDGIPKLKPSQENVPKLHLEKGSITKLKLPKDNIPKLHSLKENITKLKSPKEGVPKPQQPQRHGKKRPRAAMSCEFGPTAAFGTSSPPHCIQPSPQRPRSYYINQSAPFGSMTAPPYTSMAGGHYRTSDIPFGVSGLHLASAPSYSSSGHYGSSIAPSELSRPYGLYGNLSGLALTDPNPFCHYYPRDVLR